MGSPKLMHERYMFEVSFDGELWMAEIEQNTPFHVQAPIRYPHARYRVLDAAGVEKSRQPAKTTAGPV